MEQKRKKGFYMEDPQDLIDEFLREIDLRKGGQEPNYYTGECSVIRND
jgi:hypothetical protein